MKKWSWVWLAGTLAWLFDALVDLRYHATQQAELGFLLAVLFAVAWLFFRQSPRYPAHPVTLVSKSSNEMV